MGDAQGEAAQVPHVARIVAVTQQVADRSLELRRLAVRVHLAEEVSEQRDDVVGAVAQAEAGAACSRRSGSRSRCGRCPRPAPTVRSRFVAQTSRNVALAPHVAADPLERALLDRPAAARPAASTGSSPTSSRNSVPPSASSKAPARGGGRAGERALLVAEELAARQRRDDRAAVEDDQSFLSGRGSSSWISWATRSLPVPLSPVISTAASVNRATSTASRSTASPGGLSPTRKSRTWPAVHELVDSLPPPQAGRHMGRDIGVVGPTDDVRGACVEQGPDLLAAQLWRRRQGEDAFRAATRHVVDEVGHCRRAVGEDHHAAETVDVRGPAPRTQVDVEHVEASRDRGGLIVRRTHDLEPSRDGR